MNKSLVGLVGPSGAGATSYMRRLVREHGCKPCPVFKTRPLRADDDEHMIHVSLETFRKLHDIGAFLEMDQYMGHWYASSRPGFEELAADPSVRGVVFDLTPDGARQLRRSLGRVVIIALIPDDPAWLAMRLQGRGTDDPAVIAARMAQAPEFLRELQALEAIPVTCYASADTWDATFAQIVAHTFGG